MQTNMGLYYPREAILLRTLQDTGDPRVTRTQYTCSCHGRQFPLFVHQLAYTLEGLFRSVPRDDVRFIGVVNRQFLQVLLNTVPAVSPNGFAFVHKRGKVKVVSFDRVLDSCLLPCIGKVRSWYGTILHIEGEQPRIMLVEQPVGLGELGSIGLLIAKWDIPHTGSPFPPASSSARTSLRTSSANFA
jgi:hypothetical protein